MELEQALSHYFGFSSFRKGQKELINDILNKKDVFATLPTGGGKSICYLLPGYLLEGSVVIVSPLLSLMEDQVQQLKANGEKNVIALNSFLTYDEKRRALSNLSTYRFIFVSPEILQVAEVVNALKKAKTSLFVIDEAHCISQWGHEFRTDYLKLHEVRISLGNPTCLALTATASSEVQEDIVKALNMESAVRHIHSVDRPNIVIHVEKGNGMDDKLNKLLHYVNLLKGPGIIYCSTRNWTENITTFLKENGHQGVAAYHAGLAMEDRLLIQQQFLYDQLQVICATNAFGMGINKPNVHFVLHFHYPGRLESYLQEIGRAGRNGKNSVAILLYTDQDHDFPRNIIQSEYPNEHEVERTLLFLLDSHKQGRKIPVEVDMDFLEKLDLSEVKWRFIKFSLEKMGIITQRYVAFFSIADAKDAILHYCGIRLNYKMNKLKEMRDWLETQECRRVEYLKLFNESLNKKPTNCCNSCGWNEEEYETFIQTKDFQYKGWEMELRSIFNVNK